MRFPKKRLIHAMWDPLGELPQVKDAVTVRQKSSLTFPLTHGYGRTGCRKRVYPKMKLAQNGLLHSLCHLRAVV